MIPVYIPNPQRPDSFAARTIAKGSGIVGKPDPADPEHRVLIYYEGNLYNAVNLDKFEERLLCAWGRMDCRYPTVALMSVETEDLVEVGFFDPRTHEFTVSPGCQTPLDQWLNG